MKYYFILFFKRALSQEIMVELYLSVKLEIKSIVILVLWIQLVTKPSRHPPKWVYYSVEEEYVDNL